MLRNVLITYPLKSSVVMCTGSLADILKGKHLTHWHATTKCNYHEDAQVLCSRYYGTNIVTLYTKDADERSGNICTEAQAAPRLMITLILRLVFLVEESRTLICDRLTGSCYCISLI